MFSAILAGCWCRKGDGGLCLAATNLQSYNQASVTADAALLKSGATARYAFDTGMAASEKQLTIDLGQKFRTAELGFHNAATALVVDQATGNFSLAQANKQMAGAEKLHLELDLPYTQFLVDRAITLPPTPESTSPCSHPVASGPVWGGSGCTRIGRRRCPVGGR